MLTKDTLKTAEFSNNLGTVWKNQNKIKSCKALNLLEKISTYLE